MSVAVPSIDLPRMPDMPAMPQIPLDAAPAPSAATVTEGRLRDESISETERNFSIAMHLSPFAAIVLGPPALIAPLVLWLVRRDGSRFNDDHGRELVNFGLSMGLWHLLLALTVVGVVLVPVLWVVIVVNLVRATIASGRGEYFRYPVTVRFLG